jgi:signal-transduction protein with cAMP-binding, CBS, and nucleotidyltransferase domain
MGLVFVDHHKDEPHKKVDETDELIVDVFEGIIRSKRITMENIMTRDVITLDHTKTAHDAAVSMMEKKIGSVIITAYGRPFGIITERDLARLVAFLDISSRSLMLSFLASRPLIYASTTQTIQEAADIMGIHHIDHLPILENDKIVGMVTTSDLAKYLVCA